MVDHQHCDLQAILMALVGFLAPSPLGLFFRKVITMDFSQLIKDLRTVTHLILEVVPGASVDEKTQHVLTAIDEPFKAQLRQLGCSDFVVAVADKVVELLVASIVKDSTQA